MPPPELTPSAPKAKRVGKRSHEGEMTVGQLRTTLALVHEHFGSDLKKAKHQLEALRSIGPIDEALKAREVLEELRCDRMTPESRG
jgi:hypothetical protein